LPLLINNNLICLPWTIASAIEQFRLDKSGLEGQINALRSQIESLEAQKRSLLDVESEFAAKKAQLELLINKFKSYKPNLATGTTSS
jgi:chromosome segregation ATPase